jgi:hypothetical protein
MYGIANIYKPLFKRQTYHGMNLARYKGQVARSTCYLCHAGFLLNSFFDPEVGPLDATFIMELFAITHHMQVRAIVIT